jgi:ferrous iron transport protein B
MIGGVGGVLSFVPLIIILFTCISFLEDTGYMARASFLMDRFLHLFGLHGQSFVPMMVGFGCSVPAIMAARTLKNRRDRIITILITPFMSCGAKLPVYVLLAGTFFPKHAGNAIMGIYIAGVLLGLLSALLFRKTILSGEATPFVMELPPYRLPTLQGIGWHVWNKTSHYLKKAGTVLLAASIIIWALTAFPKAKEGMDDHEQLRNSYAGKIGRFIEPAVAPIGFDWKIGISVVTGFAAKEAVVSTLGVLYKTGAEEDEESESLRSALRNDPVFNPIVAVILMLFTLIAPPCIATLAAITAEAGRKWLVFSIAYKIALAYALGFAVMKGSQILIN